MRHEIRRWAGTTIEPMLATTADTVHIAITQGDPSGDTTATVTINATTVPVNPAMLSIETPVPEPRDPLGALSEVADVVVRFRVRREGLQITYQTKEGA